MPTAMPEKPEERHRQMGAATFNRAWELIEKPNRSPEEDAEMLATTFASRYHWAQVGGDEQRATGEWQIAHIASLLHLPDLALRYARSTLEVTERNGWGDWRLASAYEGMARAHAAAGDAAERDRHVALSKEILETVEDPEDRNQIAEQLQTVPGYR